MILSDKERQAIRLVCRAALPDKNFQVWLTGSHAQDTAVRSSDVDVLIAAEGGLSLADLSLVEEAFEQSDLPYMVDLVDAGRLPAQTKEAMLEKALLL